MCLKPYWRGARHNYLIKLMHWRIKLECFACMLVQRERTHNARTHMHARTRTYNRTHMLSLSLSLSISLSISFQVWQVSFSVSLNN